MGEGTALRKPGILQDTRRAPKPQWYVSGTQLESLSYAGEVGFFEEPSGASRNTFGEVSILQETGILESTLSGNTLTI